MKGPIRTTFTKSSTVTSVGVVYPKVQRKERAKMRVNMREIITHLESQGGGIFSELRWKRFFNGGNIAPKTLGLVQMSFPNRGPASCQVLCFLVLGSVHPGRLPWNLRTTQLKRNIIFLTIIFRVPCDFCQGVSSQAQVGQNGFPSNSAQLG